MDSLVVIISLTFKMIKVTKYNIHNGASQWRMSLFKIVVSMPFALAHTVFESFVAYAHSKGQCLGHAHFECKYLANGDG